MLKFSSLIGNVVFDVISSIFLRFRAEIVNILVWNPTNSRFYLECIVSSAFREFWCPLQRFLRRFSLGTALPVGCFYGRRFIFFPRTAVIFCFSADSYRNIVPVIPSNTFNTQYYIQNTFSREYTEKLDCQIICNSSCTIWFGVVDKFCPLTKFNTLHTVVALAVNSFTLP